MKKNVSEKIGTLLTRLSVVIAVLAMTCTMALAATNTYAENAAAWVLDGLFWLILVIALAGVGMSAVKHNFKAAVGIGIGAGIILYFVKNPNSFTAIGNAIAKIVGF